MKPKKNGSYLRKDIDLVFNVLRKERRIRTQVFHNQPQKRKEEEAEIDKALVAMMWIKTALLSSQFDMFAEPTEKDTCPSCGRPL